MYRTDIDERIEMLATLKAEIESKSDWEADGFYAGVMFRLKDEIEFLEFMKRKGEDYNVGLG